VSDLSNTRKNLQENDRNLGPYSMHRQGSYTSTNP